MSRDQVEVAATPAARRSGRYRKLYPRIWVNREFRALPEGDKLVALYVLAGPQTNRIGLFKFSPGGAAEDLKLSLSVFRRRFTRVLTAFGWQFDESNRVLWIPSWWKFNAPEGPKQLKGALTDLGEVPQSPLRERFSRHPEALPTESLQQTFLETITETVSQTFPERLPKPSPIQDQDQEQEQDQEGHATPRPLTLSSARVARVSPPVFLTPQCARRASSTLLQDDEWPHWSNKEIARRCGVNPSLVDDMRKASLSTNDSEEPSRTYTTRHGTEPTSEPSGNPRVARSLVEVEPSDFEPQQLVELWNDIAVPSGLPPVRSLTATRRKHADHRLREQPDRMYWEGVIRRIASSAFCCGQTARGQWKADFDFLLKPDTHVKVCEGKYDDADDVSPRPRDCDHSPRCHTERVHSDLMLADFRGVSQVTV